MAQLSVGYEEDGFRFLGGDPSSPNSWERAGPKPGHVEDGFRFKGGDPSDQTNWEVYRQPQPADGGFVASVKQTIGSTIRGAGQAAGDFIPGVDQDNPVTRYGQEVIDANPTAVRSLEDIKDKPWTAVKEATGNAGASVAGVVGARALGMGITAASPAAGPAAPVVALVGQAIAWFGPAAIAALPSYGSIREKQILNDPAAEQDAKAKAIATLGAATVGAIETKFGPQEWALSALTREGRKALAEKFAETTVAKAIGFGALKGAAIEGAEELVQNPVEQLASYDDPTTQESLKDTAFGSAMGAIGGGVFGGGAGAVVGKTQSQVIAPAQKQSSVDDILQSGSVDEAIVAAAQVLDAQPVANNERIPGNANVSTPTAVQPGDSGTAGGGLDLATPSLGDGVGTNGSALSAVDQRGPAAELPATDVPRTGESDLDALRTDNAALRGQAIQALQSQQGAVAQVEPLPAVRSDVPAAPQLPPAGPSALEEGGVAAPGVGLGKPAPALALPASMPAETPISAPPSASSARQVAIDAEKARIEEKRAQRRAAAQEASKPMEGLSVGTLPTNAEPVTVKDGVVYVGKYAAQNFETGMDVTVPAGATAQQIAAALQESGALGKRAKFFGLPTDVSPAQASQKAEPNLPSPEQQRADFKAAENARTAPGNRTRTRAQDANPFQAFIAKHGISSALANEFAPGKKERQAAMVQGYGPVFRKSGLQLDALAELAVQDGYLTTPDVNRLAAMIGDALRGKRVIPQYAEGAAETEMDARAALEKEAGEEQNAEVEVEAQAEREAIQALSALSDDNVLLDDDINITGGSNTSAADFLRALGATEEDIANETAGQDQGQGRARQDDQGAAGPQEVAPATAPADSGRRASPARADDEGLTAPTRADIKAQQDRAEAGARAEAKAKTDTEQRARADSELPDFTLTGSDRPADQAEARGQGGLFDRPASELSAAQLLRAAADKMDGTSEKAAAKPAEPAQQKKKEPAEKTPKEEPQEPMFSRGGNPWRSALRDGVAAIPAKAQGGDGWRAQIQGLVNKGAVKQDEIEWSGVADWLKLQTGKVTKEQVLEYLDGNGVQVKEVVLGDNSIDVSDASVEQVDDGLYQIVAADGEQIGGDYTSRAAAQTDLDAMSGESRTKYSQYTLPGGQNYREVLLTLPAEQFDPKELVIAREDLKKHEAAYNNRTDYADPDASPTPWMVKERELQRRVADLEKGSVGERKASGAAGRRDEYKSSHWDQPNVIAHLRVNDRIDADGKRVLFVEEIQSDWAADGRKKGFGNPENRIYAPGLGDKPPVPAGPFVTKTDAWLNLALKRIITMAAQEGYDRVAFVNGQQSAERYDLSKQISRLEVVPTLGGEYSVKAEGKNGGEAINRKFSKDELPDAIGKDMANKVLADLEAGRPTVYRGLDLKVGGEGMKAFYDQIVPAAVKKLLPKVGGEGLKEASIVMDREGWKITPPTQTISGKWMLKSSDYNSKGLHFDTETEAKAALAKKLKHSEQAAFDITPAMREKATQGLPMFAREAQLPAVINPSTVAKVQAAITELLGGKQLPNGLGRIVATTSAEIKSKWEPLIGKNVQIGSEGEAGVAQAFFEPGTKTVFMIADHINVGTETAVLAHELMHKHGQAVLGKAGWDRLHGLIGTWKNSPEDSDERFVYDYATRKVEAVGQELSTQELFPYAVEAAIRMGVKPSLQAKRGTVANWLESVRQSLKTVWGKITGKPDTFRAQDLVDLAFGIAQMENADALRGALDETDPEQKALQALSENDELFALPKSDKTTVEEIAAEENPRIKVRKTKIGSETLYVLTMPNGDDAKLWVRPANLYGDQIYSMDLVDGDTSNVETGRPGENPEDVDPAVEDVYLDVSNLKEGGHGNELYNIAATFAHNTGRIFIGDPSGLSDIAMRRRLENMISTALKFGTTDHIAPHPRQVKGDAKIGVPPLKWVYGDSLGNIRRMIDVSLKSEETGTLPKYDYDIATGNFTPVESGGRSLAQDPQSSGRGLPDVSGAPAKRWRTGARAAIFRALLREAGSGAQGDARGRDGLLAKLVSVGHQFPDSAKGIFYSRREIVGKTNRQHTPDQLRAMRNVGFEVDVPTMKERAQALWQDAGKKLAQGIVDQFAPVKDLDKEAYGLLRLAKGASGAFEVFLHGGKLKLTDGVYDFDDQNKGGVIDKLLIPLQGEHHDFMRWIAANRAERLTAEGRENLFSPQDIADLKTLTDGTTDFDYTMQTGPRAGAVTRDRTLIYADAQRVFNAFNKNVLDLAEQSGLIDGASRHLWEHEFYVPFYRVAEEDGGVRGANIKGGVVRQEAFKKLKGGTQELNADLLDNTLMNWAHLLDAAAKNRAAKATIEAAEKLGAATQVPSGTKKSVWFMDKGEKHHAVVDDPYLLTSITSLEYAGMRNPVMNAMGAFKHYLTMGVTASPFFKIRNLIRDSMQVVATSGISPNVVANVGKGWALTNPQSDEYFRLMAGGGTIHFGTMLEGSEAKRVQALVESGVDDATILNSEHKVKQFYRKFIEPGITAYNELGNRGEAINRASLYAQLRKQGVNHADASLQARDLMDFSMQGSFTTIRFLTQVVPFFNARLQGMYKLGRAAKEDPKRMAAVIGAASLMSLALLAAYGDDDDWKKREEWDRNNYWWFKFGGMAFRIPKPFEIGAMATMAERGFELMFDKEMTGKRFRKQVLTLLSDNLSMNPVPQLVKPILDVYANKDSFTGRPIETIGMDRLESEYRFTNRTSMTARAASTAANTVTGLVGAEGPSPVQIDHMLRGYFGWLGAFVVGAGDIVARPLTGQPEKASSDLWKVATGGMISDVDSASSRYVSQMYEQAKEIERAYATWRQLQKDGKTLEAGEYLKEHRDEIRKYRSSTAVKAQETRLNQRIRMIERSNMEPDEKRDQIKRLQEQKDRIARQLAK